MDISEKVLYNTIRNLRPELSNSITSELLSKICNESTVQPFLKWFCENVSHANLLSNDEIRIKSKLQKAGEWLEGDELDHALEAATKDCPALLKLVSFDDTDVNNLFAKLKVLKDSCKEDASYIETLKESLQNLKKQEIKLTDDIEEEETLLQKEQIKVDKVYNDCRPLLQNYNERNHEFFEDVECLLNTYADAAENKGSRILWTQMPIELFVKQMELYNHYVGLYIKQQFGNVNEDDEETHSDYNSLINNSKEKRADKKKQELISCKTNLVNSKIEEVVAKVQEESYIAMLEYAKDILNNGNLKVPRGSELQREITDLTERRDLLEENVTHLREYQLPEIVQDFAEVEIKKILKQDAEARLDARKIRFEKLKNLHFLTQERGHAHADVLRILMGMQHHCLNNITEFVPDARCYLTTVYSLSSTRSEIMQQQQDEYNALLASKTYNSYDKLFVSMICGSDNLYNLNSALDKYNELIGENNEWRENMLNTNLQSKISMLQGLEDNTDTHYTAELEKEPTYNLKPVSYEISTCNDNVLDNFHTVQRDLRKIRNKMKEQMINDVGLTREKNILWQKFLAEPNALRKTYEETKQQANKFHFGKTLNPN